MKAFTATLLAAAIATAVLPAAAKAQGFNMDTVRDRYGRGDPSATVKLSNAARSRILRLDRASQTFRLGLAQDPLVMAARLDEDERVVALALLAGEPADAWRYFFAGSVAFVGGIESEMVRVGYYNPMVDAFVLADLRDTGASFRLVGLHAMTADAMRDDSVSPTLAPIWLREANKPVPIALVDAAGSAGAAFERRFPLTASTLEPLAGDGDPLVGKRAAASAELISTVFGYPQWAEVLAAFDARLAPDVAVAPHPSVDALPADVRSDLRLAGLLRGEANTIAAFLSPLSPRLMLFVDMTGGAGRGRPVLGRAALVDIIASQGMN